MGSCLHGQNAGGNVAVARNKYNGQRMPHFRNPLSESKPTQSRHAQIEQNAARVVDIGSFQETHCRIVERDLIPRSGQETRGRLTPRNIVVDHMHHAEGRHHARATAAIGKVNRITAPPPAAFSA